MARSKQTARKSTSPLGVPRHQLAPRTSEAGSSSNTNNVDPQEEIERLNAVLAQTTREMCLDYIKIGDLKAQFKHMKRL